MQINNWRMREFATGCNCNTAFVAVKWCLIHTIASMNSAPGPVPSNTVSFVPDFREWLPDRLASVESELCKHGGVHSQWPTPLLAQGGSGEVKVVSKLSSNTSLTSWKQYVESSKRASLCLIYIWSFQLCCPWTTEHPFNESVQELPQPLCWSAFCSLKGICPLM